MQGKELMRCNSDPRHVGFCFSGGEAGAPKTLDRMVKGGSARASKKEAGRSGQKKWPNLVINDQMQPKYLMHVQYRSGGKNRIGWRQVTRMTRKITHKDKVGFTLSGGSGKVKLI